MDKSLQERIDRIARIVGAKPGVNHFGLEKRGRRWFLTGGSKGAKVLLKNSTTHSIDRALVLIEAWYEPEIMREDGHRD